MDLSEASSDQVHLLKETSRSVWFLRPNSLWRWRLLSAVCFLSILLNLAVVTQNYYRRADGMPMLFPHSSSNSSTSLSPHSIENFKKPTDFRIVGLVFAGRQDRLSILDCYLQKNLVHNGGFLDEVIFILHTKNEEDIAYLRNVTSQTPGYTLIDHEQQRVLGWGRAWDVCEPGIMYIKIDDDIVFIEDTTIPGIVRAKLENPNSLLVSANSMNQAALAWIHEHLGVVKPYLPELEPISHPVPRPKHDWRASLLPDWEGPEDFRPSVESYRPTFSGHRWLPARHLNDTDGTPIASTEYRPGSSGVSSWAVAAQQHYSFLENLENDELWRYQFSMWDYSYMRLSITFIAMWGDDIISLQYDRPMDDEEYLTRTLPLRLRRHAIVDGTGVAVHYSFHMQRQLDTTDLLSRYRAYAEENVCGRPSSLRRPS